jgi:aflatoxin B1 aldehyde reductase
MVKVIVGMMGSSVASGASALATPAQVSSFLSVVKSHGIKELDTARVYNAGKSEELLGEVSISKDFAISTKAPAFAPGSLSEKNILDNCRKSLAALKLDRVDIYYLHGPDRTIGLEEQCRAIDTLHRQGCFERFGVSNISDAEVQKIHDICSENGYVLPSVYQGGYNPIGRGPEKTLFPLLKKLNMSFYAFSPLGGGLLAKPLDQIINPAKGTRFDQMKVFGDIYLTDQILAPLKVVQQKCDEESVPLMEATLRWFMHHSPLGQDDGFILGASSEQQIERSLSACEKGPLPDSLQKAWEGLWTELKKDPPRYHN